MALNNGITIRLDPEVRDRLEAVAQRFGVKSSVLIRQAVIEKLDAIEEQSAIIIPARSKRTAPLSADAKALAEFQKNVATRLAREKGQRTRFERSAKPTRT